MSDNHPRRRRQDDVDDLPLAAVMAHESRSFREAVTVVASGDSGDTAVPVLMLAVSRLLAVGARLGATRDVVLQQRFEPDTGADADLDPLRLALAAVLADGDNYTETGDAQTLPEVVPGAISDDVAVIAADIAHGLRHFESGRVDEALWWWQFAFLSTWGPRGAAALRALISLMTHARLDVDPDVASEAEFEALHSR